MAYISLGNIDKNLITIFVGCVICFFNRLLNQYDGTLLFKNVIMTVFCISTSRFLTLFPYIILKIRLKQAKNYINNQFINQNALKSPQKKIEEIVKGKWLYIILSSIIFLIQLFFLVVSFHIKTNAWIWYILFSSIFYYLIFKVQLHKHHYLSIILIILIGLIIDLVTENLQKEVVNDLLLLIMKFLKEIFFSLYNVIAKYVMEKKYVSVYEFSFYVGLFNLVIFLIFLIFDYYFFKLTNYKDCFKDFDTIQFFIILGLIFTQLGMNLTALFTNKFNSPCHVFIIYAFGQIAYYIDFTGIRPLVFVLFIIILFISLIFTEIIEINLFGLSYNTKRNIMKRAEVDALLKDENLNDEKKECNNERENEKRRQSHNEDFIDNSEKDKNSSRQKSEHIIETENYFFKV